MNKDQLVCLLLTWQSCLQLWCKAVCTLTKCLRKGMFTALCLWEGYFWRRSSGTLILGFDVCWNKFGSTPVQSVPPSQTRVSACPSLQIPTNLVSRKVWGKQTLDDADVSRSDKVCRSDSSVVTELEFVPADLRTRWYS